jgi:hypothetical protein
MLRKQQIGDPRHAPPTYGPVVTRCGAARPQAQRRLRDERRKAGEEAARLL